jgi:hypothetical protein
MGKSVSNNLEENIKLARSHLLIALSLSKGHLYDRIFHALNRVREIDKLIEKSERIMKLSELKKSIEHSLNHGYHLVYRRGGWYIRANDDEDWEFRICATPSQIAKLEKEGVLKIKNKD